MDVIICIDAVQNEFINSQYLLVTLLELGEKQKL